MNAVDDIEAEIDNAYNDTETKLSWRGLHEEDIESLFEDDDLKLGGRGSGQLRPHNPYNRGNFGKYDFKQNYGRNGNGYGPPQQQTQINDTAKPRDDFYVNHRGSTQMHRPQQSRDDLGVLGYANAVRGDSMESDQQNANMNQPRAPHNHQNNNNNGYNNRPNSNQRFSSNSDNYGYQNNQHRNNNNNFNGPQNVHRGRNRSRNQNVSNNRLNQRGFSNNSHPQRKVRFSNNFNNNQHPILRNSNSGPHSQQNKHFQFDPSPISLHNTNITYKITMIIIQTLTIPIVIAIATVIVTATVHIIHHYIDRIPRFIHGLRFRMVI